MRHDAAGLRSRPEPREAGSILSGWPTRFGAAGLLLAAVVVCAGLGGHVVSAQRPGIDAVPAGQLWISAAPLDDHRQLLIVIDPQLRNAAVYHVDGQAGSLALKSTRNITWDLLVGDFNAQEPKPSALKKMLETGRESGPVGQNRP